MSSDGRVVLDMGPGPDNPRNSEGAFLTLDDGRLALVYSRFRGEVGHDDSPSDIAQVFSSDGGETWTTPEVIVTTEEDRAKNVMSVTLHRMSNGDVGLFYGIRAEANDSRIHLRRSTDEGATWGQPRPCIVPPGYNVVNNDRIVRLSSGRLIIPAAFHRNGYDSYDKTRAYEFDGRGIDVFYVSDDDGATWRETAGKCTMPFNSHSTSGLQEPGLVELRNGVLWAWARTGLSHQFEMFSLDQGESWTAPQPSRFTSPCSPLSMKRVPTTGALVAVWNPIPNYNGREEIAGGAWTGGRTPLVMALSKDDGNTWGEMTVLEDEPDHGYCYTAIHFTDDSMFLAYCAGGVQDKGCLNRLRVRKIELGDLR